MMNKKGATSILIIMLMVVLMVFGLSILTATLSNETLSDKKTDWVKDFYALETNVAIKLSEVDEKLETLKIEAMDSDGDLLRSERYEALIREHFTDNEIIYLKVSEEQGEYLKHIEVGLRYIIPEDHLSDVAFMAEQNYEIYQYLQTQDLFEYEDIKFGNPFIPGENE
jgi:archaellum component FlaF (FlaF/FlaG flagellin family)